MNQIAKTLDRLWRKVSAEVSVKIATTDYTKSVSSRLSDPQLSLAYVIEQAIIDELIQQARFL